MKLRRRGLGALGVLSIFLILLLPVPCLAQVGAESSESAASTDREPDDDSEDPTGGDDSEDPTGGDGSDEEPAAGRSSGIEVLVIEGARSEGLREVPISVTHFGASDIQNLRIQNVADLSAYTPNLEINTSFAASNPTLFIRGVGLKDYNSNSTGAVGIWQDGIQMNSPSAQLFSLYDIEGIEVLRGPVGGLGGRNASAGLIRMHSFKPDGEWSADGSFSYGNLDLLQFEGAVGFPIFPETFGESLSARVSFVTEFRDGYTDNKCANWDPELHGLLGSTEEGTREYYALLDPFDRGAGFANNERYIFRNLAAVQNYNDVTTNRLNLIDSDPGDGVSTAQVGNQPAAGGPFLIPADSVCGLDIAGQLTTTRGANTGPPNRRKPEGTWNPRNGSKPISDYQGLQDTYNDVEYYASRFQLRYQPTETLDILGNYHWGENRGDSFHLQSVGVAAGIATPDDYISEPLGFSQSTDAWSEFEAIQLVPFERQESRRGVIGILPGGLNGVPGFATNDHYSGFYSSDGDEKLDLRGTSVTATQELDWGRLLYVGGYEYNSRKIEDEGDANPSTELEAVYDDETWQVTQDLRLEIEGDDYILKLGGFYIHEELDSNNVFKSSIRFNIDQDYDQDTDAWNLGGDLHYDFLEEGDRSWLYQISLDGGVRYNWEQKKFNLGADTLPLDAPPGTERTSIPEESVRGIWQEWTGEATLSVKPLDNLRFYGKYTRGYKAGHFNAGLTIQPVPGQPGQAAANEVTQSLDPVKPESIDAIEIGLKSSWFDDRIELSGSLFRYWYEDLQVFDIVNEEGNIPTQQLLNANADVLGAELEATLRPIDGLMLSGGLGWLDSEFGSFEVTKQVSDQGGFGQGDGGVAIFNYKGNPLIAAPEWSLSGYAEYELPLYRWGSLVPIFDFSYKSRTYLDAQKETLISQDPYWIFNARLVYRTPGAGIEVAGWVQNFTNEEYKIDAFDLSRQFDQILEVWSEPRTYGVTISYSF